jgi:hypothetical protein
MAEDVECAVGMTDPRYVRVHTFSYNKRPTDTPPKIQMSDPFHVAYVVSWNLNTRLSSVLHNGELPTIYYPPYPCAH